MIIASVDLGRARTGIAVCDRTEFLASPYTVIFEKSPERMFQKVCDALVELKAELAVVGLPRNMDNSEGESAQNARRFAEALTEKIGIKTVMQDERGTTVTAYELLDNTKTYGKKRRSIIDAVAATVILQDYLDSKANRKK